MLQAIVRWCWVDGCEERSVSFLKVVDGCDHVSQIDAYAPLIENLCLKHLDEFTTHILRQKQVAMVERVRRFGAILRGEES